MNVSRQHRVCLYLATACTLAVAGPGAGPVQAQAANTVGAPIGRAWVMQAGHWYTDVDGVVGAIRAELPLSHTSRWLLVPGVTYSHYTLNSSPTGLDLFAPEALLERQFGRGQLRPYVGAGAGLVLINMFHTVDPLVSFVSGLRADLGAEWGARLELDTRAFGGSQAGAVGWSIGVARQF